MNPDLFQAIPNPLMFPSILSEVFQYLGLKELKRSRLVCRDWEVEGYRAMRGKTRISITSYIQVKRFMNWEEIRTDFCDSFILNSAMNIETPLTSKFFVDFGHQIKTLSLQKTKWKDVQLTSLLFDKLPNLSHLTIDCILPKPNSKGQFLYVEDEKGERKILPKLKYLNLNTSAWEAVDVSPSTTIKAFLNDFFAIAPMLEKIACLRSETNYHPLEFLFPLDLAHLSTFINGEVVDALDELSGLGFESNTRRLLFDNLVSTDVRTPRLNRLIELDLNMILRDEHVRKLIQKGYALKILEIIVTQSVTLANLHSLLESIHRTLTSLNLRYLRRSTCSATFPSALHLKHLTDLTLTGFRSSFSFLRHFTNLKRLIIIKIPMLSTSFPPNELDFETPLKNLETLEVYEEELSCSSTVRSVFIKSFPMIFPNLRRLRIDHLCDTSLRAIYQGVPQLKELIAKNGNFTDAGITGASVECRIVPTNAFKRFKAQQKEKCFPSIGILKDLRELDLHSKHLTDVGITSGVIHCKTLKKLTLTSYRLTDLAIMRLVDELELEYLRTEFCYQLTTNVVDYVVKKMGGMDVVINEYDGPMNAMEMWKFLKRNNNMQIPIMRMTKKEIEERKKSLRMIDPQPSTSAAARVSFSSVSTNSESKERLL